MVSSQNKRKYKRMSTLQGKLRRRSKGGQFSYRLIVASGIRKEFALGTTDPKVACQKAEELDSIWLAPTPEVALAQMNAIRGFSRASMRLPFEEAWEKYQVHPDRATPHTVAEQQSYHRTFDEFVRFATETNKSGRSSKRPKASCISEVTPRLCEEFSAYLKTTMLAVDTHNRKIKRLRKIFDCLKDYYDGDNPFRSKTLLRSEREEQGSVVHRQAFTKEQEEQLLAVLSDSDPRHKLINKAEIRIVRKQISSTDALECVRHILNVFTIVPLDTPILRMAVDLPQKDFEDAIQIFSALQAKADCIITRDRQHFSSDYLPILTPTEYLEIKDTDGTN